MIVPRSSANSRKSSCSTCAMACASSTNTLYLGGIWAAASAIRAASDVEDAARSRLLTSSPRRVNSCVNCATSAEVCSSLARSKALRAVNRTIAATIETGTSTVKAKRSSNRRRKLMASPEQSRYRPVPSHHRETCSGRAGLAEPQLPSANAEEGSHDATATSAFRQCTSLRRNSR